MVHNQSKTTKNSHNTLGNVFFSISVWPNIEQSKNSQYLCIGFGTKVKLWLVLSQICLCHFYFPALAADPPREPLVNDSMTILEGTSLHLHCSTQGSPAPTLTWLKDGELVGTITADELSVLEIREITPQGDGQYRCLAENEHGRASSSLNITVECECLSVSGRPGPV